MPASEEQRQPWARFADAPVVQVVAVEPLRVKTTEPLPVTVVDLKMSFWSMVVFMVKWSIAAIPAFLILLISGVVAFGVLQGLMNRPVP